jgi:heat-inducible transcriptional repressor
MELDARKQRILQIVVQDYVATAEPVGSHVLLARYSLGCKSATIRSEMAEMSERGYLRQPHTSAGRVPSDRGYRFYVDRLMPLPVIQADEAAGVQAAVRAASSELDRILRKTCGLLAAMTRLRPSLPRPTQTTPSCGRFSCRRPAPTRCCSCCCFRPAARKTGW